MRTLPFLSRLLAPPAAILLAATVATGCRTNGKEREATAKSLSTDGRLAAQFPPPPDRDGHTDRWTQVQRAGGAEYVVAKPDSPDVVRMYGYRSPAGSILTIEDLEQTLRNDPAAGSRSFERSEVAGIPVIRFEESGPAPVQGVPDPLRRFGGGQPAGAFVRTRGALFLRTATGSSPGEILTLAVSRTSDHGEIGSHYEAVFEEWLNGFAGGLTR